MRNSISVYDKEKGTVNKRKYNVGEYRNIVNQFYASIESVSSELLERLIASTAFKDLTDLYLNHLTMGQHFNALIDRHGVNAASGGRNS